MRLFLAALFFLTPLIADAKTPQSSCAESGLVAGKLKCVYDAEKVQTQKGYVVSVQKFNLINQPAPYIQFILKTNDAEYTVELGPEGYVNEQGLLLVTREEIEVTGSVCTIDDKKVIYASSLKKGGTLFNLRTKNGCPLW